jgi:SAM-dependent methyltransferase
VRWNPVTREAAMRLFRDDTDAVWRYFGAEDPYYGVITHDDFLKSRINENSKRNFFDSGERDISELMAWIESNGIGWANGRAIDFGCGVGRLLLPLSDRFENVLGIDVSPHMLAESTANAKRYGKNNVSVSDKIPTEAKFDFVHSLYVLQHIDPARGFDVIFRLWERLTPGGMLCVQVPINFAGSLRGKLLRGARKVLPLIQIPVNITRGYPWSHPGMQMNVYDINRISLSLFDHGAASVSLLRKDSSLSYAGAYIIARRGKPN